MSPFYSICIEVSKWGMIKRNEKGNIDYISPIPCPFNYGSVKNIIADDGDLQDAILLGDKKKVQFCGTYKLIGKIYFIDRGKQDHKWIFSSTNTICRRDWMMLDSFFRIYAQIKRRRDNITSLRASQTYYEGIWCGEDMVD